MIIHGPGRGWWGPRSELWGGRMEGDSLYFSRRANEERVAAMKAAHPNARQAHLDLALRYEELARAIASHHVATGAEAVGAA
jgi:hypothetical protein